MILQCLHCNLSYKYFLGLFLIFLKKIFFTSFKAAEKALIAWQYKDDAKKVNRSETLFILAQFCPEELRRLATDLQNLTLEPQRMRYPEGGHQPSKAYTRSQASKAMELANQIIEKVDENL